MQFLLRKKFFLLLVEFMLLLFIVWLQITVTPHIAHVRQRIENLSYDLMLRTEINKKKLIDSPIVIIDIDEKSLRAEGQWPWSRDKLAKLVKRLRAVKVAVIAFDMTFIKSEANMAGLVLDKIVAQSNVQPIIKNYLKSLVPLFDYDQLFAESLSSGDIVLGIVFFNDKVNPPIGQLPTPAFTLQEINKPTIVIPAMTDHLGNLPLLQSAAKHGGFITTLPDADGVLRRSPLLIRYGDAVYPSLALEAARLYLLVKKIAIKTATIANVETVEGILLGNMLIPTDALGQVIIPYIGPEKTLPYISATDVLTGKADVHLLENALVLIGTSALGTSDLHASPVQASFPGVEIQASIAAGLLTGYFPYKPDWAKGAEVATTFLAGGVAALIFPYLGTIGLLMLSLALIGLIVGINAWLWSAYGLLLSTFIPVISIIALSIINLGYGYLFEYRRRRQLKNIFSQYIPSERVEMISEGGQLSLQGESKELTVLFADIVDFTAISERLTASELKELLNRFFTPMTEIIFARHGTIDKYVGDMLMAFWGAPVSDQQHSKHALEASLDMIKAAQHLKQEFAAINLPPINIGIGINTGVMNVGDMGSKFRLAYTVLGDAVNLGSRIEALTRYYGVSIAVGKMARAGQEDFIFRLLDRVRVKGKGQATEIYELICRKEDLTEDIKEELQIYEQALVHYFMQEWDSAYAGFEQLKNRYSHTQLYSLYLERIDFLRANPPDSSWDGVYTWHVK